MPEDQLTDRELLIAKAAARFAVEDLSNQFYKEIGKTIVNRFLVFLGMILVGLAVGKGWVKF